MVKIMDGAIVAENIYGQIGKDLAKARTSGYKTKPKLVIVMVGNNPASAIYVKQKLKACETLGFECVIKHFEESEVASTEILLKQVKRFNADKKVNGILVQMPLPAFIDKNKVVAAIDPEKDVDGLNPFNMGRTFLGVEFEYLTPCTATGVVRMLEYYKVPLTGQRVAMVGAGIIAGRPTACMLSNRGATVTICNSKTINLGKITFDADIVIVAVGKAKMIKAKMVRKGAVVVDIGISKDAKGKLHGDVDFKAVSEKAKLISPVPGGVGKLTVACLMENLVKAAIKQWQE